MGDIKIISDGTGFGTRVVDSETGAEIKNITRVEWAVAADGIAMANLRAIKVPLEVIGEAKIMEVCIFDRSQACNPTPKKPDFHADAFAYYVPEVDFQSKPGIKPWAVNPAVVLANMTGEPVNQELKDYCDEPMPDCRTFAERLDAFTVSCDEKLRNVMMGITTEAQARRHGRWMQHLDAHGHCTGEEEPCETPCRLATADVEATRKSIADLTVTVETPGIKEHVDRMARMANTAIEQGMELAGRMDKLREAINRYGENPSSQGWVDILDLLNNPQPSGSHQE